MDASGCYQAINACVSGTCTPVLVLISLCSSASVKSPTASQPVLLFSFFPLFFGWCVCRKSLPSSHFPSWWGRAGGRGQSTHFPFLEQIRFVFIFPLMGDNYPQCQKKEVFAAFKVDIKPERYVLIDGSHFVIIPFYDRRVSAWKSDLYS